MPGITNSAIQSGLFDSPSVVRWLPDEPVFSLASRHHRVSGNVDPRVTCRQLFGSYRNGSQHDFPGAIDELARRTRGLLGDAESIIREHTILPYYLPFRGPEEEGDALAAMRIDGIGGLKYRLGILTSRFGAAHPLKACSACMARDRKEHHVAYWHLSHQYPGVWICPIDGTELLQATMKSTGVDRFGWHLPHASTLAAPSLSTNECDTRVRYKLLVRLGASAQALARLPPGFRLDPSRTMRTYYAALNRRGLRTAKGRLHQEEIGAAYLEFCSPLRDLPELSSLPANIKESKAQIARVLYPARTGTHPLRHLLAIVWLFDLWDSFLNDYDNIAIDSAAEAESGIHVQVERMNRQVAGELRRTSFVSLIRDQGYSATRAAKIVGIATTTAICWAAENGLAVDTRPKTYFESTRHRSIELLRKGIAKQAVSTDCGVSIPTINRTLRIEPGLLEAWQKARSTRRRKEYRQQWIGLLRAQAGGGASARQLAPAIYAWLYRNDRAWLAKIRPPFEQSRRARRQTVDWQERDKLLALAVHKACLALTQEHPDTCLRLAQICQRVPQLRAKLKRLDRLPLTTKIVRDVVIKHVILTT